jgi:hypothetical protein
MLSTRTDKMGDSADSNCFISVRSASILAVLIMLVYLATTITLRNELELRAAISDLILPVVTVLLQSAFLSPQEISIRALALALPGLC